MVFEGDSSAWPRLSVMDYITGERVVDAESAYSSQRSWDATDLLIDICKRKVME